MKSKYIDKYHCHYQYMMQFSFCLSFYNSRSYCLSCFTKPLFGSTRDLLLFNIFNAYAELIFFVFIRYDAITVALLDTPALQCTRTLVLVIFSEINLIAVSKKHLMFYEGLSSIRILKWDMLPSRTSSVSPNTEITAPILSLSRLSTFFTKI